MIQENTQYSFFKKKEGIFCIIRIHLINPIIQVYVVLRGLEVL